MTSCKSRREAKDVDICYNYDDRLFTEFQVQYMKIPSSNLGRTCYVQKLFLTFRTIFVHSMFSPCSAKRRASDKDLPVPRHMTHMCKQLNALLSKLSRTGHLFLGLFSFGYGIIRNFTIMSCQ